MMTAGDLEEFRTAIGELVDAMASFRKTAGYQGAIAAMQAENAHRAACGHGPAYADAEFYQAAKEYGFAE